MNEFELEKVNIRMVPDAPMYSQTAISGPEDAVYMVADLLKDMDRECVCVINVNAANRPINVNVVSIGAVNYAVCHPADIFKAAVLSNATGMLLVHNHPSGNVNPSKDDIKVTDRMTKASEIMGINLLDHVIVDLALTKYYSIKANEVCTYNRGAEKNINEEAIRNNVRR